MAAGPGGDFGAVAHLQFVENSSDVVFDGVFGDVQHFGDLAVAMPLGELLDDVPFPLGEDGIVGAGDAGDAVELRPDRAGHAGREDGFAVEQAVEVEEELVGLGALEEVADSAAVDGFDEVLFVVGVGEDGDADIGVTRGKRSGDLEGVHAGEAEFGEHDIGLGFDDHLERGATVAGLADDMVAARLEEGGDAVANERLVVDEDDLHR